MAREPRKSPSAGLIPEAGGSGSVDPRDYFGVKSFEPNALGASSTIDTDFDVSGTAADGSAQGYFGGAADFDGTFDGDVELGGFVPFGEHARPAAVPTSKRGASWPTGRSPDRASLRIDELEVKLAADYGHPPATLLMLPAYSYRVYVRKRALRAALVDLDRRLRSAERHRDELLSDLFVRVRPSIEPDRRFSAAIDPIVELDRLAAERGQALANVSDELHAKTRELDVQIEALRGRISEAEIVERQSQDELEKHEEALKRADARCKRVHIEIRSAKQVAAQAAQAAGLPPGTAPAEHAERIAELERRAVAMQPELDALQPPCDAARAALAAVRDDIQQCRRAIERAESQKRTFSRELGKQLDVRAAGVSEAEQKRLDAYAEAGRAVLATRGAVDVDAPTLTAISRADADVAELTLESEKLLRALDVHDHDAVRRGNLVAGAALGLIVVLILLLRLL